MQLIKTTVFTIALLSLFYLQSASACSRVDLHINIHANNIASNVYTEEGAVLYEQENTLASLSGQSQQLFCGHDSDSPGKLFIAGYMPGTEVNKNIYATSIPGVGIRITIKSSNRKIFLRRNFPFRASFNNVPDASLRTDDIILKIELIKTNKLLRPGDILYVDPALLLLYKTNRPNAGAKVSFRIDGRVPAGTCDVAQKEMSISMGEIPLDRFKHAKNNNIYSQEFIVKAQCQNVNNVYMTIKGKSVPGYDDVFSLNSTEGSAAGFGLQFIYHGQPVKMGKTTDVSSLLRPDDRLAIPMQARYFKTSPVVKPGSVVVYASVTLDYL